MIFIMNNNQFFLHSPTSFNLIYSYDYAEIDYLVDLLSYQLLEPHIRDCLATPARSALNYW